MKKKGESAGKGAVKTEEGLTAHGPVGRVMEKVDEWPGLFVLWKCGDDYQATLQPALDERRSLLMRGCHTESASAERKIRGAQVLKRALLRIEVAARTGNLEAWSAAHAADAYSEFAESLGRYVQTIRFGKEVIADKVETNKAPVDEVEAEKAAQKAAEGAAKHCKQVFAHAIDSLLHDRFPRTMVGVHRSGEIEVTLFLNAVLLPDEPVGKKAQTALKQLHALAATGARQRSCNCSERPRQVSR